MPHFHLHMRNGRERVEDRQGAEYNSLMSARTEAIAAARETRVKHGKQADGSCFEIADDDGDVWLVVPFFEAIIH